MAQTESWQTAEVPGPTKAMIIPKPDVVASLISKSKRPIIISGSEAPHLKLRDNYLVDYVMKISETFSAPIIATSNTIKVFDQKKCKNVHSINAIEVAAKLSNPEWGLGEKPSPYDTAVFLGFKYYMLWLILSGLKHYALHLNTISLERYYQPHAAWSFPNLTLERWIDNLEEIIKK